MSMFRRVRELIKANINSLIDGAEDPQKMLEQLMRELRDERLQLKKQVVKCIADEKRLEHQVRDQREKRDQWQKRAEVAVFRDEDELAREAISRRNDCATMADELTRQWEDQHQLAEQLKDGLDQLNRRLDEAEVKKQYLISQLNAAKAKRDAAATMAKLTDTGSNEAFVRINTKILEISTTAAAAGEMASNELEDRFARLEGEGVVEHDLINLKLQMGKSVPQLAPSEGVGPAALPAGGAQAAHSNGNSFGAGKTVRSAPAPQGVPHQAADVDEATTFA